MHTTCTTTQNVLPGTRQKMPAPETKTHIRQTYIYHKTGWALLWPLALTGIYKCSRCRANGEAEAQSFKRLTTHSELAVLILLQASASPAFTCQQLLMG